MESSALNPALVRLTYMGLRERLLEVMDDIGGPAELARKAGVSKAAVSDWRSGKIASLKALSAVNIQERTGYSVRWLILGIGPKKIGTKDNLGELAHQSQRALSPPDDKKLLVVLRGFLDTDTEGRNQIVEAVKAITGANGTAAGQPYKPVVTKRR